MSIIPEYRIVLNFDEGDKPTIKSFFSIYRNTYNLSSENEIIEICSNTDKLGHTHHRYKQYYKNLEIADLQFLVHEKNGLVHHAHGKLIHGLNLDISPSLSETSALEYALKEINADEYMWENTSMRYLFKGTQMNFGCPKGKLMLSAGLKDQTRENFRLVYRFEINTAKPFGGYIIDVDANDGSIVRRFPTVYHNGTEGFGESLYNGLVPISISKISAAAHLNAWNAYGESGKSWWFADSTLGLEGGYDNMWYQVLDTDPILLSGENPELSFYHRYSTEPLGDYPFEDYDALEGMNVRVSIDSGKNWQVLENPQPEYSAQNVFAFGSIHGEGKGIPGWSGLQNDWVKVTFDLATFENKSIQIRFAFASDVSISTTQLAEDLFGWQIDEIMVKNSTETLFSNSGTEESLNPKKIYKNVENANYELRETYKKGSVHTMKTIFDNDGFLQYVTMFTDDDTLFSDMDDKTGVSVHWASQASLNYYDNIHGRNSFDNNGSNIYSYVNWIFEYPNGVRSPNNAMWGGLYALYGKGDGTSSNPWVSLDIVAHEITHGVTGNSAGLIYANEYGALNESFSDIFGSAIEIYKENIDGDWLIGEDISKSNYYRSLKNPKYKDDPDTYKGNFWVPVVNNPIFENDFGGVHSNNGVQNYWFYLLCEGGEGINDNGDYYIVNGIGIKDAEQIAYRNLTQYLMPTSNFEDARLGSIHSAIDLFGINSEQHQSGNAGLGCCWSKCSLCRSLCISGNH